MYGHSSRGGEVFKFNGEQLDWSIGGTEGAPGTPWPLIHLAESGTNMKMKELIAQSGLTEDDMGTNHNEMFLVMFTSEAEVTKLSDLIKQRVTDPLRRIGFLLVDDEEERKRCKGMQFNAPPPNEKP